MSFRRGVYEWQTPDTVVADLGGFLQNLGGFETFVGFKSLTEFDDWGTGLDERLFTLYSFYQLKFESDIVLKLTSFCQYLGKDLSWDLILMDMLRDQPK